MKIKIFYGIKKFFLYFLIGILSTACLPVLGFVALIVGFPVIIWGALCLSIVDTINLKLTSIEEKQIVPVVFTKAQIVPVVFTKAHIILMLLLVMFIILNLGTIQILWDLLGVA
jgi:hypothetical protein